MTAPLKLSLVIDADGKGAVSEINRVRVAAGSLGAGISGAGGAGFDGLEKGAVKAGAAVKLAKHEAANLAFQMQDVAVMLASGQSPFLIMAQQGSQISQIMGSRGIGQILPALAGGLMSLVNPTTLALAAVTALGYAAAALFSGMNSGVKSADEALAAHEAAIKGLKDAWGEAGKGIKDYVAGSVGVAAFMAGMSAKDLRTALEAETRKVVGDMSFITWSSQAADGDISTEFNVEDRFRPFQKAIENLKASIEAGKPDIQSFHKELLAIAALDPTNEALQRLTREMVDSTTKADTLARGLKAAEDALDGTAFAADRAEKRFSAFARSMQALAGVALPALSDLEKAEKAYAESQAQAGDYRDRIAAYSAYQAALKRIAAEAEGAAVPVPTPAPNREEWSAERDKALADEAKAQGAREQALRKLTGALTEQIARAELDMALTAAGIGLRNRAAAALEAERLIRERGLDVQGREADAMRQTARHLADIRTEAEKAGNAWASLKSAGEGAIDGMVDKLAAGDFAGALKSLGDDIMKFSLQMAVANPLKNALFGGDNPEWGDLKQGGGWIGKMIGKLTGSAGVSAGAVDAAVGQVASVMTVTAASVIVNGGITGGGDLGGLLGGGAAQTGAGGVAAQAWNFFAKKGLKPHQIAGVLGNLEQESGFDPLAVGDGGTSFGLGQHHAGRGAELLAAIGGKGKLSDAAAQLDFIWKELQGSENGALKKLLQSSNVKEATAAFAGYERPQGWSAADPEAAHGFAKRLNFAEQALEKFGKQAAPAAEAAADLGQGAAKGADAMMTSAVAFTQAGQAVKAASLFPSAPAAPGQGLGGLFSSLFKKAISPEAMAAVMAGGGGLYDSGGWTGDGSPADVAGVVHRREFVVKAGPASRHRRLLEALNSHAPGYASGGWVGGAPALPASPSSGAPIVQIIDNAGVAKKTEQTSGPDGRAMVRIILDRVEEEMGGGRFDGALSGRFGIRPGVAAR